MRTVEPGGRDGGDEGALTAERDRLVRLCWRMTGDPSIAEDLAQEALLKAWRGAGQLREPERRAAWLAAIARNECLQWLRRRGHEPRHVAPSIAAFDGSDASPELERADDVDVAGEIERQDLRRLLDQATGLLPKSSRQLLLERYVHELPLADIAARHKSSNGTLAVRLHRARLALRHVLVTAFPAEVAELGLAASDNASRSRTTRIWCPWCGRQRLVGMLDRQLAVFHLDCPDCGRLNDSKSAALFSNVDGYRAALARLLAWCDTIYRLSLVATTTPCPGCGTTLNLRRDVRDNRALISYYCSRCHMGTWNTQRMNVLALPESRQFWREHPRMEPLPEREIEVDGRRAIVSGFVSRTTTARIEVIYQRDTLDLVATHRPTPA